ncbi:unnamed protein product, partial [Didymodactylos carnosus]
MSYGCKPKLVEMQPPKKSGGNQIAVTSRFVGYQFYPLIGLHIQNSSLLLMNHQQAEEFVKEWIIQVGKCIFDALLNERIQIDQETVTILLKKRDNIVKTLSDNSLESLTSNPSLLSLIFLQQQGISNNRKELCAFELISLLNSDAGIVAERGKSI